MQARAELRRALAEAFPLETFGRLVLSEAAGGKAPTKEHRAFYREVLDTVMTPALAGLVGAMATSGTLPSLRGTDGHRMNFVDSWDSVLEGVHGTEWDPRHHLDFVAETFSHDFLFANVYDLSRGLPAEGPEREAAIAAAWNNLLDDCVEGRIRGLVTTGESYCAVDDKRYKIVLDGWQPTFSTYSRSVGREPIRPITRAAIETLEIEFPTGELLVADWFRIPAFSKAAEALQDEAGGPGINSADGCVAQTRRYAEGLGFLSVSVGNTVPTVAQRDGDVMVGWADEDGFEDPLGDLDDKGTVCTDLWWATVIDRKTLVDIVAGDGDRTAAEAEIDAHLAEIEHVLVRMTVAPGVHHVAFAGHHEGFGDAFKSPDVEVPEGFRPFFVMTDRAITLDDGQEATASRKP